MKFLSTFWLFVLVAFIFIGCQEDDILESQPQTQINTNLSDEDLVCGTEPFTPDELDFMQDPNGEFIQLAQEFLQKSKIKKFRIPIRAHVLRRNDGSGGISQEDIDASISRVNWHYRQVNIEFYVDRYNFLDNTTDYNTYLDSDKDRPMEVRLASDHAVSEAINVFFVQNSNTSWAYGVTSKNWFVMNNSHTRNESTFSHELGHYFGLPHTHANGDELVNGSNCGSSGDRFCDTPADPNLLGKVTFRCGYTGTDTDANGDLYSPMTNNIMAYTRFSCRGFFTSDQRQRILYTYIYKTQYKNKTPVVFYDKNAGLGQIWHFNEGRLQERTYSAYGWRKSWHAMTTFEESNQSHILLYDKAYGNIQMYDLTVRGKLGSQNYNVSGVSKDWDIVQSYEHRDVPYVLFYDRESGRAEIHRVRNGRLAEVSYSGTWNSGWDIIRTYQQGHTPYMMFYDRHNNRGWIYSLNGGRLQSRTYAGSGWSSSWDIIETFEQGNTPYAVFYDRGTGRARMYRMSYGKLGTLTYSGTWQTNWNVIAPYHEEKQPYLIFYNDGVGTGKIYDVVNGRLNQVRTSSSGWLKSWNFISSY